MFSVRFPHLVMGLGILLLTAGQVSARPLPIGESTITVSYETHHGLESYSGNRNYFGSGPTDATVLPGAPNIAAFNSANTFGRRAAVANNPAYASVFRPEETLMAHAFFKRIDNLTGDYFPGIHEHGMITVSIENIRFDQPVVVDEKTVLLHALWNDQNKMLSEPYHHIHNIHSLSPDFRDASSFLQSGELANHPSPNYVLGDTKIEWLISGDGTDSSPLSIVARFPYDVLRNLEDEHHHGQMIPDGLPAPHGFLEPFHFHIEYAVTPEPGMLALLGLSACGLFARRRRA